MKRTELYNVCKMYLGDIYRYNKVKAQVDEFAEDLGLTYDDIAKVVSYWYDIRGSDPKRSGGGIGIVPHIYQEALDYWADRDNLNEIRESVTDYKKLDEESLKAPLPLMVRPKKLKMFNLR